MQGESRLRFPSLLWSGHSHCEGAPFPWSVVDNYGLTFADAVVNCNQQLQTNT